ncbi:MAG: hypothetical protein LBD41_05510 [Clostridiales Family XIII bacterium]|jgi:hypothetical protein|nr:hypothetical protein [Clostridiales Family XIII bacterium]
MEKKKEKEKDFNYSREKAVWFIRLEEQMEKDGVNMDDFEHIRKLNPYFFYRMANLKNFKRIAEFAGSLGYKVEPAFEIITKDGNVHYIKTDFNTFHRVLGAYGRISNLVIPQTTLALENFNQKNNVKITYIPNFTKLPKRLKKFEKLKFPKTGKTGKYYKRLNADKKSKKKSIKKSKKIA